MLPSTISQRLGAEFLGTAFLLAAVVGSGIMAERLAGGNVALALLCNTIPTGAILFVLITMLGPISGAHFNPAVTVTFWLKGDCRALDGVNYILVQIGGGIVGVLMVHLMFEADVFQFSQKARTGPAQWLAEGVATFGLVTTILLTLRANAAAVPAAVGLYITSAYWFTASTSFANPAVTIARAMTDSFAGIRPLDAPAFIVAQCVGAVIALAVCRWLVGRDSGARPARTTCFKSESE